MEKNVYIFWVSYSGNLRIGKTTENLLHHTKTRRRGKEGEKGVVPKKGRERERKRGEREKVRFIYFQFT